MLEFLMIWYDMSYSWILYNEFNKNGEKVTYDDKKNKHTFSGGEEGKVNTQIYDFRKSKS